jgi:histone deacetylase 1/2
MALRGGRGGGRGRGRDGSRGRGRGNGGRHGGSDAPERPICQLCGKEGHTVVRCYKHFDRDFTGAPEKSASSATTSYGIDTNWYSDTGASDHITGELEKLTMKDKYHGVDQVHVTNGSGMKIDQIGDSIVRTPNSDLVLKDVLYVPQASKNLLSVHKLALNNHAFFEFYPHFFA